jgi:hypothetical protein
MEINPLNMQDGGEIERAVTAFARSPNGGLIVTAGPPAILHRNLIVSLAARHKLPAVYNERMFATAGGLISYGPDYLNQYRGRLRRPHPQGRESGGPARAIADQVRNGDQSDDRQGARPRRAGDTARYRRRGDRMSSRREFITLLGGAAAWPLAVRAQQGERMRRIGVLMGGFVANDPEGQARVTAFQGSLQDLGWVGGRSAESRRTCRLASSPAVEW